MKQAFWDHIAPEYESEIFDVLSNDKKKILLGNIHKYGSKKKLASDIGCGPGRFLPALSDNFKMIYAYDISPKLLQRAEASTGNYGNIKFIQKDFSIPGGRLPKVDFALSVNSFLDPSITRINLMFDNVIKHLIQGAVFLIVVPALESALYTDTMLIEWNLRLGMNNKVAVKARANKIDLVQNPTLNHSNISKDGVLTRHFLKEEMITILERRGMKILNIEKLEYPWDIEFFSPPKWMKEPLPWDWFFLAKKISK